jgi:hypothetical protein
MIEDELVSLFHCVFVIKLDMTGIKNSISPVGKGFFDP